MTGSLTLFNSLLEYLVLLILLNQCGGDVVYDEMGCQMDSICGWELIDVSGELGSP